MTSTDRAMVLELVTDAVLECEVLEHLPAPDLVQAANLIRRTVARRLPADALTPTGIQHD